jgi:hypothetical protein
MNSVTTILLIAFLLSRGRRVGRLLTTHTNTEDPDRHPGQNLFAAPRRGPAEGPPRDASALAAAIGQVRDRHSGTCDLASRATPAATVTAVRAEPGGVGYLALSDSSIVAEDADPDGQLWPRGKLRDDATIVYWQHP